MCVGDLEQPADSPAIIALVQRVSQVLVMSGRSLQILVLNIPVRGLEMFSPKYFVLFQRLCWW